MKRILFIPFLLLWCTSALAQTMMQWAGGDPVIGPSYRTVSTPVLGGELVVNGGFDSGTTGWSSASSGSLTSVAGGVSGNCLQVRNGDAAYGNAQQGITVTTGLLYRVSGYHKNGLIAGHIYGGTSAGGSEYFTTGTVSDVDWTLYTRNMLSTGTSLYLRLGNTTNTLNDTTLFDSLSAKSQTLSSLLAPTRPFGLGTTGGRFYWTPTTANCGPGEWLGAWVCTNDTRNPTQGLWAFVNRTTGNFELRAVTAVSAAGAITSTSLINTAVTFSSGAQALLVVDTSNQAAPFAQCFYNNAAVGAKIDLTAYASWINANRRHAIQSTTAVVPGSVVYDFGQMVLGSDLLAGWDFTSGWTNTNSTINDLDTFTVSANNGRITKAALDMVSGGLYRATNSGTYTAIGSYKWFDNAFGTEYLSGDQTGTYCISRNTGLTLVIGLNGGSADITSMTLRRVQ